MRVESRVLSQTHIPQHQKLLLLQGQKLALSAWRLNILQVVLTTFNKYE